MTPVPLDLPLRPSEAAEVANLIFEQAEHRPLTDAVRNRIAARATALRLETLTPHFGSLERDPVHPSTYYLAVHAGEGEPQLLHIAAAAAPTSSIFHKPLLVGRMRRGNGTEMVINALPFGASSHDNVAKFATQISSAFLPRPQGSLPAIAAVCHRPEVDLPAAFDAFRAVLKGTGKNFAAIATDAASIRSFYHAGIWAAICAGWREGYSTGIELEAGDASAVDAARAAIREAAGFTRFAIDASRLFAAEAATEHRFETTFTAEERGWIFEEFARPFDLGGRVHEFPTRDVLRLAVKFGRALQISGQLYDHIRQTRAALKTGRAFDFELVLERDSTPTTPEDLLFCLHWLKAGGHAAQLVAPNLGDPAQLPDPAAVARHYQCTLSVKADALAAVARATGGRVNCTVPAGDIEAVAQLLGERR